MKLSADSTWIDAVQALALAQATSLDAFALQVEHTNEVVRACATATSTFGYLEFMPATDATMSLAAIASVFTPADYPQMVEQLLLYPANILNEMNRALASTPGFESMQDQDPEGVAKLKRSTLNSLTITLGEPPENIEELRALSVLAPPPAEPVEVAKPPRSSPSP